MTSRGELRLGAWEDVLHGVTVDALIVDPPYSKKTHDGHREGAEGYDGAAREDLAYDCWEPEDVERFVAHWAPRTRGWFVAMTDDVLFPVWRDALERAGRLSFADVPFIAPGSRVRTRGDGPSCWTTHLAVARPRTARFAAWGTLPGAYVLPRGLDRYEREQPIIGGKPLWLLRQLVDHYTRPGDLVGDPCAGAATGLVASVLHGRFAVGAERHRGRHAIGARRITQAERLVAA